MRPFHRTLRTLWVVAAVLVELAVLLWASAFLGLALLPGDDGLGTAFIGIYLILLGMLVLAVSLGFLLARRVRESRARRAAGAAPETDSDGRHTRGT